MPASSAPSTTRGNSSDTSTARSRSASRSTEAGQNPYSLPALALTTICALGTTAFAAAPLTTTVTKSPSDESRYAGETATFIAGAVNYDSAEWFFIAPSGTRCDLDAFKTQFPACTVKGQGTMTLKISNLQTGMNGWQVFCAFTLGNDYCTTTVATLYVSVPSYTTPAAATYVSYPVYVDGEWVYYEYYEPDYVIVDGVRVYSDGSTVVTEDREPDWIEEDGSRVYVMDDEPDYIMLNPAYLN